MSKEKLESIIKKQMSIWIMAILFATCFALFAKLIWTAKFPILIMLPIVLVGFCFGSLKSLRDSLSGYVETDSEQKAT